MRLDYGTQISPTPITLSIGTLRKPTLKEISKLTFDKFSYYEFFIKMTPEIYFTKLKEDDGKNYWNSLSKEQQEKTSLYDLIEQDEKLRNTYIDVLNFFFIETVIFQEGYFILLNQGVEITDNLNVSDIRGVMSREIFMQVLDLIQQICCICGEEENLDEMKFKNNLARQLMEKMLKEKKQEKKKSKSDKNITIPNIISALSNKHPSLNYTNIWDLTIFQLLDSFNRIQANSVYEIDSIRVSVWGDEKKTFDASLWYKNEYDKK